MDGTNHVGLSRPFPVKNSLFFKFQGSPSSIAETSLYTESSNCMVQSCSNLLAPFRSRSCGPTKKLGLGARLNGSTIQYQDMVNRRVRASQKIPQLVKEIKESMAKHGILSTLLGHVGDGTKYLLRWVNTHKHHINKTHFYDDIWYIQDSSVICPCCVEGRVSVPWHVWLRECSIRFCVHGQIFHSIMYISRSIVDLWSSLDLTPISIVLSLVQSWEVHAVC
jgi:hypothetical protein